MEGCYHAGTFIMENVNHGETFIIEGGSDDFNRRCYATAPI